MADSGVVEVRCERCKTSFAPEWKQCVHCGGPLGQSGLLAMLQRSEPASADQGFTPGPFQGDDQGEEIELQGRGRNLIWVFTAVAAMLMSALRACGEG